LHLFLSKSEFWSPNNAFLKSCVHHRPVQANFFISHNPLPDLVLAPHPGYHAAQPPVASDTYMPQQFSFEVAPFPSMDPLASMSALQTDGWADSAGDPSRIATSSTTIPTYSDHITTVNTIDAYGVPDGTTATSSGSNPPNSPVVIDQKTWYSAYGIDRDANGLFHCPFAGCGKENKRRDQLWEHWKARHNDDPYRCNSWSVLQYSKSLVKRSNSELSNKTWIYNGEKAHACNAEITTCQFWFVDARCAWCVY
jgi:hypothetical protein